MASALVPLIYPLSNLLSVDSLIWRYVFASLITFTPIFFANLLFSMTFREQKDSAEQIFGWNLIGAASGGLLEYASMLLGYNALAGIIAACYLFVCLLLLVKQPKTSKN
jgi:hypothetical protein